MLYLFKFKIKFLIEVFLSYFLIEQKTIINQKRLISAENNLF